MTADADIPNADPPFASADEQAMYDWVWHELAAPATPAGGLRRAILLVASLGLFVWAARGWADPATLAILVAALVVHELGHYLGMVAFGYRDVRMFFVPFLGAAVSGTKHAAPAWQRGVVALLGPLPGIVLAAVAYLLTRDPVLEGVGLAVVIVVGLNVFNLIPIEPFDGGRVMHVVVFSRSPVAEVGFLLVAIVVLGGGGWLIGEWVLVGVAGFLLLTVGARYQRAKRAAELRHDRPNLPSQLTELDPVDRLRLFRTAVGMLGGPTGGNGRPWPNPKLTANVVRGLHEAAVVRPPGFGVSCGLLAAYGLGWALAGGLTVLWVHDRTAFAERDLGEAVPAAGFPP